ncbi:TPA: hypothetical protein MD212_002233 [Klebsiella pneumoniae]|nr:hypothetical protein [Klebsiella pneumoniae]
MSIWNFLSFDAKAKIINALPLAYANFIGHQHITANSQNGDTDWLGQPLPVELAEISDFNKSTGEFTFSFVKPQTNGGSSTVDRGVKVRSIMALSPAKDTHNFIPCRG